MPSKSPPSPSSLDSLRPQSSGPSDSVGPGTRGQRHRSLVAPTPIPATLHLQKFKDWSPEQLKGLLERQASCRVKTSRSYTGDNVHGLEVFQTKLQSHVFQNMPIRMIKLPEMDLMERGAVVSYLIESIKTGVGEGRDMAKPRMMVPDTVEEIAKFAILSHTWMQEEPSYVNFSKQRERDRKGKKTLEGYRKLQRFCEIAHSVYGVQFAWADTVCIDKSSSTELNESIRSMFAWYRNSDVCIAYLGGTTDLLDCPFDRWFTRGWTLQEILAPHRLKFYNKDWRPLTNLLNDKISPLDRLLLQDVGSMDPNSGYAHQLHLLQYAIFMATGLDMTTIYHFRPGIYSPSLPERMKWVAQRVTTRPEDKAYCMMGVFGVSISVAYGEGAAQAFFRLFAAILEVGYSRDWFMWTGEPIPFEVHPSRMIPSSPKCYLSRDKTREGDLMLMDAQEGDLLTLTSQGLPMKMLIIPACVSYDRDSRTSNDFTSIHISCPLSDKPVVVKGRQTSWGGRDQSMQGRPQFALGVLNIVGPEIIDTPKCLYGILLRRPTRESRWASRSRWTYAKWEKWETEKTLTFQRTERFPRMGEGIWNEINISRPEVGWSAEGDEPKIKLQTLYL